jgi:ribonuclease BN (tRNA processing enzyme)
VIRNGFESLPSTLRGLRSWLLGSGGWIPTEARETACVLVRSGENALVLDAGTGFRRLVGQPTLLEGIRRLDVVLTHFHLDHTCGLAYVPALAVRPEVWAPGAWLYETSSAELLDPLRRAPISPFEPNELGEVRELLAGPQTIGAFELTARAQPRHWAPTAGFRVGNALVLITDTAYDPGSSELARGAEHLLHEAWSTSAQPVASEGDATAADAGRVAHEAGARRLTLVHVNPRLESEDELLSDARTRFPDAQLGRDATELQL